MGIWQQDFLTKSSCLPGLPGGPNQHPEVALILCKEFQRSKIVGMVGSKGTTCSKLPGHLYDVGELFPKDVGRCTVAGGPAKGLQPDTYRWISKSHFTCSVVGLMSKFWLTCANSYQIYNKEKLMQALENRPINIPLITVANHISCMDEPLLWGILKVRQLTNQCLMRWAIAAHDICFSKKLHSLFFAFGKSIPVVRGDGVYQPGVDFSIARLNEGHWVHLYPEGKVNMDKVDMRYKWGVGRMIAECKTTPLVVPIYHLGMDDILPSRGPPYIPRIFQRVTVLIGDPIDVSETLDDLKKKGASDEVKRRVLTDLIEVRLKKMEIPTKKLHEQHLALRGFKRWMAIMR